MIDAFPPDLNLSTVGKRRAVSDAFRPNPTDNDLAIGSISVAGLLPATGDPFGRRVRGHPKRQDLPPAIARDQQTIEQPERDCRHDEEVYCDSAILHHCEGEGPIDGLPTGSLPRLELLGTIRAAFRNLLAS